MELRLGGLCFTVEPEDALSRREHATLEALALGPARDGDRFAPSGDPASGPGPVFRLDLSDQPFPWSKASDRATRAAAEPAPAAVTASDGRLRVTHHRFEAEIDAFARAGRLWRCAADGTGLLIALRVALSAALPLRGGLPVHAAGIVADGRGLCFFGPSGAGKSTLAGAARARGLAVLSDEQVSLFADPPRLAPSGFWGALDGALAPGPAPLSALFELDRGPALRLERLAPGPALRRLLGVLLVPPQAALWSLALAVVGRLVHAVPVYRMAWSPDAPPWDELLQRLAADEAMGEPDVPAHAVVGSEDALPPPAVAQASAGA